MAQEKRQQMMHNLFGEQSDDELEVDSGHGSSCEPGYLSEEVEGAVEPDKKVAVCVEGKGKLEEESEAKLGEGPAQVESEDGSEKSSVQGEVTKQKAKNKVKEAESNEHHEYGQGGVRRRGKELRDSKSKKSDKNHDVDNEDNEADQGRNHSKSPGEEKDQTRISHLVPETSDVFGDSEKDESEEKGDQNEFGQESHRSLMEVEGSDERDATDDDIVPDEDSEYGSNENYERKPKVESLGPPLELEFPLHPPPGRKDKMNMVKVSNIMGVEPKPFARKTYVEDDIVVTDKSGSKRRIRLENNVVRWRRVQSPDGMMNVESNARFVRWSDGSLQLLIGNEILDISVQEARYDQAHLFLRHGNGTLQSQGRLLRKMRFMPSSLSSNSHRLLTALVDSRHKKVYKVKNCIADKDPEREKEEKEKAESQTIRATELLQRKREKLKRKYAHRVDKVFYHPSYGSLAEGLDEDEEAGYNRSPRLAARPHLEEYLEAEAQMERRLINAKRVKREILRKAVEFSVGENEDSEYESERNSEYGDDEQEAVIANEAFIKDKSENKDPRDNHSKTHRRLAVVYESDEE
ncbi:hypothetical protein IFM89_020081 [Coptis chinensis]|uniref:RNA polymerase-associated protein LEO1 n=1 Tax=Coptis chinensis TaxID=261450 RepID=A0A835HG01_9MAGN|nr:hypothetical protein IFM89_020081 [Coptis chinensis]